MAFMRENAYELSSCFDHPLSLSTHKCYSSQPGKADPEELAQVEASSIYQAQVIRHSDVRLHCEPVPVSLKHELGEGAVMLNY